MSQTTRAYNFNAGPSALPLEVLEVAQKELVNYKETGMSVMELSHRSKTYDEIHNEAIALVRELLAVPQDYHVLFLQGGASLQFGMVPLNFLSPGKHADYILTGSWSEKAYQEAKRVGEVRIAASTKEENYRRIPQLNEIHISPDAAYVHLTSNNTIFGTQWQEFPDTGHIPLVADMSSDIMSKPIDVSRFGLIYAGAQKNLGPSGVTLVIIHPELVEKEAQNILHFLKYSTHVKGNSLYNTPPTFVIYMLGLMLKWVKKEGGLAAIANRNEEKARLIYEVIDQSDGFYKGHAEPSSRSLMNVTFRLQSEELEKQFLQEAKDEGFVGLNGHRSVGGCRASLYNGVPLESCQALRDFMLQFMKRHG